MKVLTHDRLIEVLDYCPDTGVFRWKETTRRKIAGSIAGTDDRDGYRTIKVDGKQYRSHRLVWFYVCGVWPSKQIDHINRARNDNRIDNLRDVTSSENKQNRIHSYCGSKTGFLGVTDRGVKFEAQIRVDGKDHYLGRYDTISEAHDAYLSAKKIHHPTAPRHSFAE